MPGANIYFNIAIMNIVMSVVLVSGCSSPLLQRYGSVIGIDKENIDEYVKLHQDTWPGVLNMIEKCRIQNYSIYLGQLEKDKYFLFSYFEYTGDNFEKDMAKMAQDKTTQEWWTHTDPLQRPIPTRKEGEHWAQWQEVFHHSGPPSDKIPQRFGSIIGIEKDNILAYTQMHDSVWPGVLASIERCNIRNYSIYLGEIDKNRYLLFSYFEYIGDDYEADMESIANEVTRKWWTYTDPLQKPLPTRKEGEHWASMQEVFHHK